MRERLTVLEREIAEAEMRHVQYTRRQEIEGELDAARQALEETIAALRELAQTVGFEAAQLGEDFYRWLKLVHEHDQARQSIAAVQQKLEALRKHASELRDNLVAFLARYGETPELAEPDAGALDVRLSALGARLKARDAAEGDRVAAERRLEELDKELARVDGDVEKLFIGVALRPGDDNALRERLDLRD
ncbi:MAG: hypothetical protein GWN84_02025, partial [Gammaproteobacteria bacterium]|nr:hypothetical protein [Gammaproteobacteria bacterium]